MVGALIYLGIQIYIHYDNGLVIDKDGKEKERDDKYPFIPKPSPLNDTHSIVLLSLKLWGQMFGYTFLTTFFWWLY